MLAHTLTHALPVNTNSQPHTPTQTQNKESARRARARSRHACGIARPPHLYIIAASAVPTLRCSVRRRWRLGRAGGRAHARILCVVYFVASASATVRKHTRAHAVFCLPARTHAAAVRCGRTHAKAPAAHTQTAGLAAPAAAGVL